MSMSVERPRKNANPRTAPTVSHHSTNAPMSDTVSATRMVRHAAVNSRCAEFYRRLPDRRESINLSKKTTYESTVTPTDKMIPAVPASVSARPFVRDSHEMTLH